VPGGPPSTGYCGTCGAPIEPGQQFCGQCGAPAGFGGSGVDQRTVFRSAPLAHDGYGAELDDWSPADHDAPTEEFAQMLPGARLGYSGAPYGRGGSYAGPQAPGGGSELRVVLGILCILGGLVSGAGAIILALWQH
jgi:hypothetical protein